MEERERQGPASQARPQDSSNEASCHAEGTREDAGTVGSEETGGQDSRFKDLEDRLLAAEAKARENWDLFLRSRADFDNYRKASERQRDASIRRGKRDMLLKLLEIRDNLERALRTPVASVSDVLAGVEIIVRQLDSLMATEGVVPVEAVGKPFDPAVHEAVASWESPDVKVDTVTDEIQRGYTYQGEVLRVARVRVATPARPDTQAG